MTVHDRWRPFNMTTLQTPKEAEMDEARASLARALDEYEPQPRKLSNAQRIAIIQARLDAHGTRIHEATFTGGQFYAIYNTFWNLVCAGYYVERDVNMNGMAYHLFDVPDRPRNRFKLHTQEWLSSGVPRGVYRVWQIEERHFNPQWLAQQYSDELNHIEFLLECADIDNLTEAIHDFKYITRHTEDHMNTERLNEVNATLDEVADQLNALHMLYEDGRPLTDSGIATVNALANVLANLRTVVVDALKEGAK